MEEKTKEEKSVDQQFREIDKLFDKFSEKNHEQLSNAEIKPIHEKYPFAQNGICAFIAPMGSGKSYNYMKLSAKQEVLFAEPFFELIVICSTSANFDQTVKTFTPAIKKSKLICDIFLSPYFLIVKSTRYISIPDASLSTL